MRKPLRVDSTSPVPFVLNRDTAAPVARRRECVIDARMHTSKTTAGRLLDAIQSGTGDYVLSSRDGSVSARVTLSLTGVATTEHETSTGRVVVDWSRSLASNGKARVSFSGTELRLLAALLEGDGQVVSRAQLIARVWPNDKLAPSERENALAVYVCGLRKRLRSIGIGGALETVRRAGYRLVL